MEKPLAQSFFIRSTLFLSSVGARPAPDSSSSVRDWTGGSSKTRGLGVILLALTLVYAYGSLCSTTPNSSSIGVVTGVAKRRSLHQ